MGGKTVEDCVKEVKNLENKASLSREICAYQYKKYRRIATLTSLIILLSAASISLLSIANPSVLLSLPYYPQDQQFTSNMIALLGFIILIFSYSDKILGLTESMNKNEQGSKILTGFVRDCHTFRDVESKDCDEAMAGVKLESIKEQYDQLNQFFELNTVSNKTFLKIKKAYKQKIKVSKMLDVDPDIDINKHYLMRFRDWLL